MTRPSVQYAQVMAAKARRNGYPDAQVAEEYCIDGETIGFDNFLTFTATVYVGSHQPTKGNENV